MKIEINIRQTASGCFQAYCAAMPGCVAVGTTHEQVCQNMRREIGCYVASMDAISPERLDLAVAVSVRPGDESEPRLSAETAPQLNACRKLPA